MPLAVPIPPRKFLVEVVMPDGGSKLGGQDCPEHDFQSILVMGRPSSIANGSALPGMWTHRARL